MKPSTKYHIMTTFKKIAAVILFAAGFIGVQAEAATLAGQLALWGASALGMVLSVRIIKPYIKEEQI